MDFDFGTFFQIENCHAWFENQIQFYAKKKNHKNDNF